jgi:hypothetical protein
MRVLRHALLRFWRGAVVEVTIVHAIVREAPPFGNTGQTKCADGVPLQAQGIIENEFQFQLP